MDWEPKNSEQQELYELYLWDKENQKKGNPPSTHSQYMYGFDEDGNPAEGIFTLEEMMDKFKQGWVNNPLHLADHPYHKNNPKVQAIKDDPVANAVSSQFASARTGLLNLDKITDKQVLIKLAHILFNVDLKDTMSPKRMKAELRKLAKKAGLETDKTISKEK